nr:LysR family transcriptional regulator [Ramlibacter aurantiacus]
MKIQHLRALVAVVDSGGIRAAARTLGLTQAALAKSLQSLEEAAGLPLLVRRATGITPTPAGELLLSRGRFVLHRVAGLKADLQRIRGEPGGRVSACVTAGVANLQIGLLLASFRESFPEVSVALEHAESATAIRRVQDGSVEMAIVDAAADVGEGFVVEPLATIARVPVVRRGHPILSNPTIEGLGVLRWISRGRPDSEEQARLRAAFRSAGAAPPGRVLESDPMMALSLARALDAVAVVPATSLPRVKARGFEPVEIAGFRLPSSRHVLVVLADSELAAPAQHFRDCVRRFFSGSTADQVSDAAPGA